ncbi:MAG: lysophospholipid acyltransferase family protein [Planctomycetes bacterium]|nr:lysophospholipid acyltransferase family protein [Planctomycetota bacterium]
MKLHKRIAPYLVPRLAPLLLRLLSATWRIRSVDETGVEKGSGKRLLYCFWHGDLLVPMHVYRGTGVVVLVSGHRDGVMLKAMLERMGFGTVVGSTTRGGTQALRGLLSEAKRGRDLCVPPDGPKGPRHVVKPGIAFLASRARLAIVPAASAASRQWNATSWDKLSIPKPFAKVVLLRGPVIELPRDLEESQFESTAQRIGEAIHAAAARARELL